MGPIRDWERLMTSLRELDVLPDKALFKKGDLVLLAMRAEEEARGSPLTRREQNQLYTEIAAELNYRSGDSIYKWVRVSRCFPCGTRRASPLKWAHYLHASYTQRPDHWLEQAEINRWTPTELKSNIAKVEKQFSDNAEVAQRDGKRLLSMLDDYIARFAVAEDPTCQAIYAAVIQGLRERVV